jgi:predicted RNA polymerase sigma factor
VAAVHQTIYAAYVCGWEAAVGEASTAVGAGLAEEALLLARLCADAARRA